MIYMSVEKVPQHHLNPPLPPAHNFERPVLPPLKLFSRNVPANSCFDN